MENLSKLIKQKQDKKYYLTELGVHAYNSMQDNRETITSPISSSREFNSPLIRALMYLTPKRFISFKSQDRIYNSTISLMILIIGAILTQNTNWKNVEKWVVDRRRARGMESNAQYAEKFNMRFDFNPPTKYII